MSLVILNGGSTASVLQNADLSLSELNDVTISSISDNDLLQYDSATGQWNNIAPEDITELDLTGRIVATDSDLHSITRETTLTQVSTLKIEKDIGTETSFDDYSVGLFFNLTNNTSDKHMFQFKANNDATLGKRMVMSEVNDAGDTLTNIATFANNLVDIEGELDVGGTGNGLIESATDLTIDCGTNDLTITANEIFMDADGGTY